MKSQLVECDFCRRVIPNGTDRYYLRVDKNAHSIDGKHDGKSYINGEKKIKTDVYNDVCEDCIKAKGLEIVTNKE